MLWLFITICLIRSCWWIFIFSKLIFHKDKPLSKGGSPKVSVLICVKNNASHIDLLLNALKEQSYPNFEVIVIDDFSQDDIEVVLDKHNLPHILPDQDLPGKKAAVNKGVSVAQGKYILCIDSDCLPHSSKWIDHMMAQHENNKLILGYSPFYKRNTFIHFLQNYENAYIGMQYLSYAKLGWPYMGVGRNLLFEKNEFLGKKPFEFNMDIASGDDDFIVLAIGNKTNTGIALDENSFTFSHAQASFNAFVKQKIRHLSTAHRYPLLLKVLLTIFGLSHLLFYMVLIGGIIKGTNVKDFIMTYLLFISIVMFAQYYIFQRMTNLKAWILTPLMDFTLALVYLFLSPYTIFTKNKSWN